MRKYPSANPNRFFTGLVMSALIAVLGAAIFSHIALAADPGAWTVKSPMPTARFQPVVEPINGLIYVVGGINGTTTLNVLEVYDPITNSWSTRAAMPTVRYGAASGVINGKLYVAGGYNRAANQYFSTLEVYDPTTNTWATKAPMPTARVSPGFGVIGGKLYVVGGDNNIGPRLNILEVYDPVTDTWTTGARMPTIRASPTVQVIDERLYVAGGDAGARVLEVYNPVTNIWDTRSQMPTERYAAASGVIGGRFYVASGRRPDIAPEAQANESYDPVTNSWRTETSVITARWGAQGAVINETLYVIGGGIGANPIVASSANEAFSVRALRVSSSSSAATGTVALPIELISQGDENTIGFSLTYNTSVLSNAQATLGSDTAGATLIVNTSQTAQGRVGIAVALPATQKFATGARQIANVTFTIAANAIPATTLINFGDQPISRQVVDASANALPATYTPGAVMVTPGYEADVSPRPNGNNNGSVTVADWVLVGRFAAGLDAAAGGSEFQRADCAPKVSLGDGRITLADWVQAGRYAAGIDPVVAAGGPTTPTSGLQLTDDVEAAAEEQQQARTIRAINTSFERGQNGTLTLELDAQGNENALGFSLSFDPAQLRFVSANVGSGAGGASLNVNTNQAASGRVGLALALPTGQTFAAGTKQLLVITFAALSGNGATTTVTIGDQPVGREIVDAAANSLNASWAAATVTLARSVASVSAASFNGDALAAETIVAAFGTALATSVRIANTLPLPTQLAGTSVRVRDSLGVERLAALFFVAPTQINYLVPAGTAAGEASVTITSGDGSVSRGKVAIANVAPGLFSANASGQGIAAATVLRVKADGSQSFEPVGRFDSALNKFVALPIDLGSTTDQVFLILFGTGIRHRSALSSVTAGIGGAAVEVFYASEQGGFLGLDQINLRLPRSLAGRGEVDVALTIDGATANRVRVSIK